MTPKELEDACLTTHMAGLDRMTLTLPAGEKYKGFPRGELLSVNPAGGRNYSFDPLKVLIWLREKQRGGA
jgi:hypothetical protein